MASQAKPTINEKTREVLLGQRRYIPEESTIDEDIPEELTIDEVIKAASQNVSNQSTDGSIMIDGKILICCAGKMEAAQLQCVVIAVEKKIRLFHPVYSFLSKLVLLVSVFPHFSFHLPPPSLIP